MNIPLDPPSKGEETATLCVVTGSVRTLEQNIDRRRKTGLGDSPFEGGSRGMFFNLSAF